MDRIAKLKEFLQANPQDSFVQHALALEYVKAGDDASALNQFEELLDREPGYVGSYYHLGKLLERTGDINKALKIYQKGMEESRKAGDNKAYGELREVYEELNL